MGKFMDHTGEINIASNGQRMTIIKYTNSSNIDVQFEDGTIIKHKVYDSFKKGKIKNPNKLTRKILKTPFKDRTGEESVAFNGLKIKI